MKSKLLTLLFLFISSVSFAQYSDYGRYPNPYGESGFGIGVGYNLNSVVGKEIRPVEISLRYRIYNEHLLQLYVPLFNQTNSFKSDDVTGDMVNTSLETKKQLFGIGFDYDYALYNYKSLDFVIGARFEYALCKDRSDLSNKFVRADANTGTDRTDIEDSFREKRTKNFVVSPNAGFRLRLNKVYVDAKVLMSMLSMRGDLEKQTETQRNATSNDVTNTKYTTESISNKFKLKPAVLISMGVFF